MNLALLLASYYLLKTVREALILTAGGAEVKTYSAAAQAILLVLLVPAYGAFASRVERLKLITWVTIFFVAQLIAFYFAGRAGVREGIVLLGSDFGLNSSESKPKACPNGAIQSSSYVT